MRWQQLKTWVKRFLLLSLILITLSVILTIFLNQLIPKTQLKNLILTIGRNYLAREIDFKKIYINIFNGIIINNIEIRPLGSVADSADFKIDEIQLRHNWKSLLKLKIDIDKIIVKNLKLEISKNQIRNEIAFYKKKFKIETPEIKKKPEIKIDIKEIEIFNNQITYTVSGKKILQILFDKLQIKFGSRKGIKLNTEAVVMYKNIKNVIEKEIILTRKKQIIRSVIYLPEKNLGFKLKLSATNRKDFIVRLKTEYKNELIYSTGNLSFISNILKIKNLEIRNRNINGVLNNNGYINFETGLIKLYTSAEFNSLMKQKLSHFIKLNKELDFNLNGSFKLKIMSKLNKLKNATINGNIVLNNSRIKITHNIINIRELNANLFKNSLEANTLFEIPQRISGKMKIKKNNIFSKIIPVEISGSLVAVNLKNIITNYKYRIQPENVKLNLKYFFQKKKLAIENISFSAGKGKIKANGIYYFDKKIGNIYLYPERVFIEDIITNLKGNISGNIKLSFGLNNNKVKLHSADGIIKGNVIHREYNFSIKFPFKMRNYIIDFSGSKFFTTRSTFRIDRGELNLNTKILSIKAHSTGFNLADLKEYNISGISKIDFSFNKNLLRKERYSFKLNIYSDNIIFNKLKFINTKGNLLLKDGKIDADLRIGRFYAGSIKVQGNGALDRIKINAEGRNINLEKLIKDISGENISGRLKFDFSGIYNPEEKRIKGTLEANAVKGEMYGTRFQKKLPDLLPSDLFYKNMDLKIKLDDNTIFIEKMEFFGTENQFYLNINGNYKTEKRILYLNIKGNFNEEFVKNVPNLLLLKELEKRDNLYYLKPIKRMIKF